MGFRDGLFRWTIPAGRWGGTAVRVSALLPLVGVAAVLRTGDAAVGLAVTAGLLLASAAAEAMRCAVAARTGAPVRELLLWPLGGLEDQLSTPARPPWVHLCVPATAALLTGFAWALCVTAGVPFGWEPEVTPAGGLLIAMAAVAGANLLPAWPLAAGRAVRDLWAQRSGPYAADAAAAGLTHLLGALWLFLALALGSAWVAVAAAAVMLASRERRPRPVPRPTREERETFLGYDFSAGYTSLEREEAAAADGGEEEEEGDDESADARPAATGPLANWRRHREAERRRREQEERLREDVEVDRLLRKISAEGETSLSAAERRTLQRVAARLRQGSADG